VFGTTPLLRQGAVPVDVERLFVPDHREVAGDVAAHHLGPVDDEAHGGVEAKDVRWEERLKFHSPLAARTL
jgi:hypothetical protein